MRKAANRYWAAAAVISLLFVVLYLIVAAFDIGILQDPGPALIEPGILTALAGLGLLSADVVLPVPSSAVMVANGALFGVLAGASLSVTGRAVAFLFGYYLGAKALPFGRRFVPAEDLAAGAAFLEKNGPAGIMLSRPIPILSETVAIMAGFSTLPVKRCLAAALAGSVPEAVVFGFAGAYAAQSHYHALAFIGVLLVTGLFWLLFRGKAKVAGRGA